MTFNEYNWRRTWRIVSGKHHKSFPSYLLAGCLMIIPTPWLWPNYPVASCWMLAIGGVLLAVGAVLEFLR